MNIKSFEFSTEWHLNDKKWLRKYCEKWLEKAAKLLGNSDI